MIELTPNAMADEGLEVYAIDASPEPLTNGVANPNYLLQLGDLAIYQVRPRDFSIAIGNRTTTYGVDVPQDGVPFTTQGALPMSAIWVKP